ncbi:MAG: hypothetical protein JWP63_280 [Candidatus Solibacter sp.]|jgi:type VI secretion system secreted protein Hcp|nr:hypothetical protein [Candidatus Solibacter sp.]
MVDAFLKIDGIEGESQDSKHGKEIEILSYSYGATQPGTASAGGGMGAGKVAMADIHFTHTIDKASPKLMLACCTGDHIKSAIFTVRKAGGTQLEYVVMTLSDVLVSSVQISGHGDNNTRPMEQFSLNFSKIQYDYKEQKADGSLGGAVAMGYDIKQNKKV